MCGIDPIAKGELKFVSGAREGMPEIKPLVPISPRWDFVWELERR